MTAVFLVVWFYVYAGLMFATVSNSVGFFPNVNAWIQVLGWPVFSLVQIFRNFKDSELAWFFKYVAFKVKN